MAWMMKDAFNSQPLTCILKWTQATQKFIHGWKDWTSFSLKLFSILIWVKQQINSRQSTCLQSGKKLKNLRPIYMQWSGMHKPHLSFFPLQRLGNPLLPILKITSGSITTHWPSWKPTIATLIVVYRPL